MEDKTSDTEGFKVSSLFGPRPSFPSNASSSSSTCDYKAGRVFISKDDPRLVEDPFFLPPNEMKKLKGNTMHKKNLQTMRDVLTKKKSMWNKKQKQMNKINSQEPQSEKEKPRRRWFKRRDKRPGNDNKHTSRASKVKND